MITAPLLPDAALPAPGVQADAVLPAPLLDAVLLLPDAVPSFARIGPCRLFASARIPLFKTPSRGTQIVGAVLPARLLDAVLLLPDVLPEITAPPLPDGFS